MNKKIYILILSIKLINNKFVTIKELNGNNIYDPEIFEQRETNEEYFYPFGEFGFKVKAKIAKLKMYFSDISDFNNYLFRKRLNNNKYANKILIEIGQDTINNRITSYIIFEIEDGSLFDYDGIVNDVIYDPGGPAIFVTNNIPTLSERARIILISLLLILGFWKIRDYV